jgi:hypothetical protein
MNLCVLNFFVNVAYAISADELNVYFTTPATGTGSSDTSHISYYHFIQGGSFSFFFGLMRCELRHR